MSALVVQGAIEVSQQLTRGGARMRPVVAREMLRGATRVMGHMKERYLSGNPLKVRENKLRGGWNVSMVTNNPKEITVSMHTATIYAPAQNYGFHGMVRVKAHTRRIKASRSKGGKGGKRKQLRSRSEARARSAHTSGREASSQAAHGTSVRKKQAESRAARGQGSYGFQGVEKPKAGSGIQRVPAHDRFMKLKGHHFVERSIRDKKAQVLTDLTAQTQLVLAGRI